MYLGSPFTADGLVSRAVKAHADAVVKHIIKFTSFLSKNNDVPFIVKKRVFDAALMSAVLYGCESWLNADVRPIAKLYHWALKSLLGVRGTTCNDLCYVELGYPTVQAIIKSRQRKFFKKMYSERRDIEDDPFIFALNLVTGQRYNTRRYVLELVNEDVNDMQVGMGKVKESLLASHSSRRKTYLEMNPNLTVNNIYMSKHNINERDRISFTRFRISGHSLAVEVGRWSRRGRGRLPLEERLCPCGEVQTEVHVAQHCILTQHIRDYYDFTLMSDLFSGRFTDSEASHIINMILSVYMQ